MNPLNHFGIRTQFIRGDTSSYNYYPGIEYEDGVVRHVDRDDTNKMNIFEHDKRLAFMLKDKERIHQRKVAAQNKQRSEETMRIWNRHPVR